LQHWPFDSTRVGAWIIEHNFESPKRSDIREILEEHGYPLRMVQNNGVDDYYVADEHWPAGEAGEAMLEKDWREHPAGSHGC
jgi:hypothetical protein